MNTNLHVDVLSLFIFFGVCLGFLLSAFFIFKSRPDNEANRYQGLLLLSLSLGILEQLLNLTGYIVKVLPVTNFSEPLNLIYGPLIYLYVKRSIDQDSYKKDWMHFIPFLIYLLYSLFYFVQSPEYKYNSYVDSFHPDWPLLKVTSSIPEDPLGIRSICNQLTIISMSVYLFLSGVKLVKKTKESHETVFNTKDETLKSLRDMLMHFIILSLIFLVIKLSFRGDLGDYFIGIYISFFILLTSIKIMNDSTYFDHSASFMDVNFRKYNKSTLTETNKQKILEKVILELETHQYFSDNLASLSSLAKKIGESPHHVSQVINEKLNKSFFNLLASYRIEEAKSILSDPKRDNLTIEEISEMVGYNSKTAFNNSFKRFTGKTPSEFRKSINP
jgi:AraC-like DNA-binding protein